MNVKQSQTKNVASIWKAWAPVLFGGLTGAIAVCFATSAYVQNSGMLRDSNIAALLPDDTVRELIAARPVDSIQKYIPGGSPGYIVNGKAVPMMVWTINVRLKDKKTVCGSSSSPRDDNTSSRRPGAFGFQVVDGHLVTYSSGDVREHPQQYKADVRALAAEQISFWRNPWRLEQCHDSL